MLEAKEAVLGQRFDAILLDLNLPDGSGLNWISELRRISSDVALVVITGEGDMAVAVDALRRGADHFLTKPVSMLDLDVFLQKSLELGGLRRVQAVRLKQAEKEEPFFGESDSMKKLRELASVAAENSSPVLLLGETGTGKGVLARWIHAHSHLKSSPFVEVNCSGLRGELLASELFGHTKGSFTSAVQDQQGLLEVADGGTLFLDEIGDMDFTVQTQFLKVIEEKQYRRVGDVRVRKSDFRLICATNRDLKEEIKQGRFRRDLYFRIFIFPIQLPSLRERLVDLPGLVRHLLQQLNSNIVEVPETILQRLSSYDWPGNIRELKNVLERAILLARGGPLAPQHFADLMLDHFKTVQSSVSTDGPAEIVLNALRHSEEGLTRTEISALFANHKSAQEIGQLLTLLNNKGLVRQDRIRTSGRPVERWHAILES